MSDAKHTIPRLLEEMKRACRRPLYTDIVLQTNLWKEINSSKHATKTQVRSAQNKSETPSQESYQRTSRFAADKEQEKSWQQVRESHNHLFLKTSDRRQRFSLAIRFPNKYCTLHSYWQRRHKWRCFFLMMSIVWSFAWLRS